MWNPVDYAKNSDAQLKWAQELRNNIDLQKYKSILDVGCGDGKITADFAATTQFVDLYLAKHPLDSQGLTHVSMVRLEVDACRAK